MTGSDDENPPDDVAGTAESTADAASGADAPPDGEHASASGDGPTSASDEGTAGAPGDGPTSASDGGTVTADDGSAAGDGPVPPGPEEGGGGVDDLPRAEDPPGDDLSPRNAMMFGGAMVLFGAWLGLSGGGYCLALFDTCLVSAPVFGFLVLAFGALSLWAGWDSYRKGEETV